MYVYVYMYIYSYMYSIYIYIYIYIVSPHGSLHIVEQSLLARSWLAHWLGGHAKLRIHVTRFSPA